MRAAELGKLMNRNAVLLALNYLAGERAVLVGVAATDVAPLARRSLQVTRAVLADLEREKVITRLGWRDGISCRVIVLMDRPGARAFVRENRAIYGPREATGQRRGA